MIKNPGWWGTDYSRRSWLCRSASAPSQRACEPVQDRCLEPCSRPGHAAGWRSRNRAPAGWVAWATNAITEGREPTRYHRSSAIKKRPLSGEARKSLTILPYTEYVGIVCMFFSNSVWGEGPRVAQAARRRAVCVRWRTETDPLDLTVLQAVRISRIGRAGESLTVRRSARFTPDWPNSIGSE